jgi:hypothetical protein
MDEPSPKPESKGRRRARPEDLPAIFALMAEETRSLRAASREMGIDHPSVLALVRDNDDLRQQYAHAREVQGEDFADEITTVGRAVIAGKIPPDQGRVGIDAFKWAAGRMAPKAYGEKLEINSSSSDHELAAKLAAILEAAAKRRDGA